MRTRKKIRDEIIKKAYRMVSKRLDKDDGKAIDELVKLVKADKDLNDDEPNGKEVDLVWTSNKTEPRDK